MYHPCLRPKLVLLLVVLSTLAATSAPAQQTTEKPKTASTDDTPVKLSPFTVSSERTNGYQATSTLAGTRLNTPVKDLAASISIYTKDFMEDIGATNAGDLMVFATGMEGAGLSGGNWSGSSNDINATRGASDITSDAVRDNPQGAGTRARGLGSPTFTRNYFPTSIPFDTYNVQAVTVNRGPNAALFGVGSPAGVVDTALAEANIHRDLNQFTARYGNNDARRESLDVNRVLLNDRLAARIILLQNDERYNQHPAFETSKRIYGALRFDPLPSDSFRASFESGNINANRPMTNVPYSGIAQAWYNAGRPSYDWRTYDDPALNPNAAGVVAGAATEGFLFNSRLTPKVSLVYANPTDRTPTLGFIGALPITTAGAANAVQSSLFQPVVNRDTATDTIRFLMTPSVLDIPAGYWTGANVPAGQQSGFVPAGLKSESFSDYSAFDWRNQMIDASARQSESFHTLNLSFEQRFWQDRIGVEVAYNRQRHDSHARDGLFSNSNTNLIYVDVNVTLPDGRPNPNLGRPFAMGTFGRYRDTSEDRESKRATAYLKYDFRDLNANVGWWLGHHTLTGLWESERTDTIDVVYRMAATGDASNSILGNIAVYDRYFSPIVYMGPSIIGNSNALKLQQINLPTFTPGPVGAVTYFSRAAGNSDPGSFATAQTSIVDVLQAGTARREEIDSGAAVLQSYWLDDLVVTTLGWRRDHDYYYSRNLLYVENPSDRSDPGKVHYGFNDISFPGSPPPYAAADFKSYGVVLRWPQKLFRIPGVSDASVFINGSSNFTPLAGRVDLYNNPLASPSGTTREWGVNLSSADEKFTLRLNHFETSIKGASLTPSFFGAATVNAVNQTIVAWATEGNVNPQLAAQRNADIALMLSALPSNWASLYDLKVSGSPPNVVASNRNGNLSGSGDTTDYVASGLEADIIYNPTRNWRILLNVAKQETVQSNSYPILSEFIARMKPVWDKLANTPKGNYPAGFQPGSTLPASVQTFGQYLDANVYIPFATALATEGVASAEQRKWRANLVTNYMFTDGKLFGVPLRGLGLGSGVRWQDKVVLGYPTTRNANSSVNVDLDHPYYGPTETNVDFWASYERRISKKLDWKVQFNVVNAIGPGDLIAVNVQSFNGAPAAYRLPPERRFYLTNTFKF